MKNFNVQLRALAKKAFPTPVIPAFAFFIGVPADTAVEAARSARETATYATALVEIETFKNNQIRRVIIKPMHGWLRSKLMERPIRDTIHGSCTFAIRQLTNRHMCRKEVYLEDGYNEIENQFTETLANVLNRISQTEEDLRQKITDLNTIATKQWESLEFQTNQSGENSHELSVRHDQQGCLFYRPRFSSTAIITWYISTHATYMLWEYPIGNWNHFIRNWYNDKRNNHLNETQKTDFDVVKIANGGSAKIFEKFFWNFS